MSAKYNLVCEQATTFNFQFTIKNDSTPWNLTNYTAVMTVRPFVGASTTVAIGITGTAGKYLAATSTASAGTTSLQAGLVDRTRTASAGETLFLTIGGANPTTARKIKVSLLVSGV